MPLQKNEKIVLFGASRGLGAAVADLLTEQILYKFSRTSEYAFDLSRESHWGVIVDKIKELDPQRLFYFAGGGPYGDYAKKEWKDHEWSWNVSFRFPAFLLHSVLTQKKMALQQVVFCGSAIAENQPDPGAGSYAAAKHALKGLVTSVQLESPRVSVKLFSPGYMATPMLGAKAQAKVKGVILDPQKVAAAYLDWVSCSDDAGGHLVIPSVRS